MACMVLAPIPVSVSTCKSQGEAVSMTTPRARLTTAIESVIHFALTNRRATSFVIHVVLIVLANYLAFALRYDGAIPPHAAAAWKTTIVWLVIVRSLVFVPLGLYEGLWRYTGIWDLQRIAAGVVASSVVFWIGTRWITHVPDYPRSVYLIDAFLLVSFMGGVRLTRRILREARRTFGAGKRVLIMGAGDAGEMIVRDMHRHPAYGIEPIGFIDDDPKKKGKRIHGLPVFGDRHALGPILESQKPDELLIAIPSESPATLRGIAEYLRTWKIPIATLPSIHQLVSGQVTVAQIRPLAIEDLLPRAPVDLDSDALRSLIAGKRVLVTGAGGSIGSELCRQIAALGPARLALVDRYENSLHAIATELADRRSPSRPYLADTVDRDRIDRVFADVRPQLVFHAAAHKHVPMVEMNPSEGFKNNVLGTRTVAEAALACGAERFVFISTDKAVNPTSIMGATKRTAEFYLQTAPANAGTSFCAVRFGNVLGSNGSVVPRFLDQIAAGGPVTVTHPDVRRYFMLIPEAVKLVLHAAAQSRPGAIYVLEMGDQINLAEMARNLIRLTGHVPDEEIRIDFVGLRPGEKLFEELVGNDETTEASDVAAIQRVVRSAPLDGPAIRALIDRGIDAACAGRDADVIEVLRALVPTYRAPEPDSIIRS